MSSQETSPKTARLTSFGSPLTIESTELPSLSPQEVSVNIHFSGINFYELMIRNGTYPTLPSLPTTLGGELAGEILETGSDVTEFKKGDRVFAVAQTGKGTTGSYAQVAHVNEQYVYHLPQALSYETGAAFPMMTFATYTMITKRVHIPKDGIVLVHSAAGGVGSTLVQFVHSLFPDVTIIGTCSNNEKAQVVQSLGANIVVNTQNGSFANQLGPKFAKGINVIFDPIGQGEMDANLSLLRPVEGTLCSYGTYTGPITDSALVGKLRRDNLTLSGFLMWPLLEDKEFCLDIFSDIFELLETQRLTPLIDKVFPLEQVNDALARVTDRKNIGKVLLQCQP